MELMLYALNSFAWLLFYIVAIGILALLILSAVFGLIESFSEIIEEHKIRRRYKQSERKK
jgi:hypothetical protein